MYIHCQGFIVVLIILLLKAYWYVIQKQCLASSRHSSDFLVVLVTQTYIVTLQHQFRSTFALVFDH